MTKKIAVVMWMAVLTLWVWTGPVEGKSAAELLQEGTYAEEIEGDLDKAVKLYDQVIAANSSGRSYMAQAMYRKGMCFLKKRDEQGARVTLEKLLADFADQTAVIDKAKAVLEDLTVVDLASLMPPQTLAYVELGSPGRQIETILNMLKGTPFENPLAAMAGGKGQSQGANPQDILGNFFNPSMMAEFKKIRGMAAGVIGIPQNNQSVSFVIVLYPGKSDALRGLLLAVLGVAGRRIDPIEGMESFNLQNSAFASYDENVIIIANPLEQLQWSTKRHKGVIKEPSLATSTGSFARFGKDIRQGHALTLWVNVDQAYAGASRLFPKGQMPQKMRMADGFVDFNGIDDLTVQLAMKEQGISFEAIVNFKDGHRCLAYDLIRTPNLNKAAFETVPSEAIALASYALADPQSAQAKAVSQRLQRVTGLDVEREIYGNLEQVTLFVVPQTATGLEKSSLPPIAHCLGLSITSHDPQRTRQVISTLLGVAQLIAGGDKIQSTESASGRFQVGDVDGKAVYCHMSQANKATVLSLNPAIVESAIGAQKTGSSVCKAGPLSKAVNAMPASTSKLILINHGGAVRMIAAHVPIPADANEMQQAVAQLAQACDKTLIQVCTNEQVNQLTFKASMDNLPPLNQVIGPIMQLSKGMGFRNKAWSSESKRSTVTAEITQTTDKPAIDGKVDDLWAKAKAKGYELKNSYYEPASSPEDCSASFKTLWDKENLYLLVEVKDEDLRNDSDEFWQDDSVEVFIDADNSKSDSYDNDDYQYHFDWDATSPAMGEDKHQKTEGVKYAFSKTDKGYNVEISFPWTTLGAKPAAGTSIGLDVQVNDDDGGGDRDSKIAWSATEDNAWENPSVFGNAFLPGLVAWWKLDETSGGVAADSSGNGHNGSLNGNPTWQPSGGKVAGALQFHGNNDFVVIESKSAFDITGQVTVAAWIKVDQFDKDWRTIVAKGDSAWRIQRDRGTDGIKFACSGVQVPGGGEWGGMPGKAHVKDGQWHYVAGVYDGTSMCLYVDSALDVSQPA